MVTCPIAFPTTDAHTSTTAGLAASARHPCNSSFSASAGNRGRGTASWDTSFCFTGVIMAGVCVHTRCVCVRAMGGDANTNSELFLSVEPGNRKKRRRCASI